MDLLLRNKAFWAALVAVIYAILYYFVPTFPKEIWNAVFALVEVLIGALAVGETRQAVVARRAARKG
jgi:hypothetical protein